MEYKRTDIRNIAFEPINDRFSRGKYLGIEVTVDMNSGYINGSHLVGQVLTTGGNPKRFVDWKKCKEAQEIIEYLTVTIVTVDIIIDVTDAPNGLRGTYIHPRLVAHVAQWASPIFADKVAVIINDKAISEAIAEKNRLLQVKDDKIDELLKEVRAQSVKMEEQAATAAKQSAKQSAEISELLRANRETQAEVIQIQDKLDDAADERTLITDELFETKDKLDEVKDELTVVTVHLGLKSAQFEKAVERRVPPEASRRTVEILELYGNCSREYRAIRCQMRSRKIAADKGIKLGYTSCAFSKIDPNAISIWNQFKRQLPASMGSISRGNIVTLAPGVTEAELVAFISTIDGQRRDV